MRTADSPAAVAATSTGRWRSWVTTVQPMTQCRHQGGRGDPADDVTERGADGDHRRPGEEECQPGAEVEPPPADAPGLGERPGSVGEHHSGQEAMPEGSRSPVGDHGGGVRRQPGLDEQSGRCRGHPARLGDHVEGDEMGGAAVDREGRQPGCEPVVARGHRRAHHQRQAARRPPRREARPAPPTRGHPRGPGPVATARHVRLQGVHHPLLSSLWNQVRPRRWSAVEVPWRGLVLGGDRGTGDLTLRRRPLPKQRSVVHFRVRGSWRRCKDDDGSGRGSECGVLVQVRIDGAPQGPQSLAFGAMCHVRRDAPGRSRR